MSDPTWTILVPTLGERAALLRRLLAGLLPQIETEQARERVTVLGWFNDGHPPLPEIRQRMLLAAKSDYVCFVDDDDLVSPDYVSEILTAIDQRPDYVGFQVQCYSDGVPTAIAHHSLKHRGWKNSPSGHTRDISHINPMRAEIARSADFRRTPSGRAEDRVWVEQLRRGRRLKTEVEIPHILYHYLYSTNRTPGLGSRWQHPRSIARGAGRPVIDHPNFEWIN